jgi:uncharacterized sulfatase
MSISRRKFLGTGAAAATASVLPALAGAVHGRKNVLFISVDDLTTTVLGCYGGSAKSPNIDALAARGVRFGASYCQYPLCNPSRSSLMTGLSPDTTKIYNNNIRFDTHLPDAVTIPALFRRNGYYSARVGKIYHTGVPGEIGKDGFDEPSSWDYTFNPAGVDHTQEESSILNYTPNRPLGAGLALYESPAPDNKMTDSLGADEAIRLLRANADKPFFLALGLYRPHVAWVVPTAYYGQYPLEKFHPAAADPEPMKNAPLAAYSTQPPNFGLTGEEIKSCLRAYYASTTFMDKQVGRVFAALKDLGLENNTVVVFWGDHGWCLGEHGQWQKNMLFEPSAKVPFIMAGPGIYRGGVCHRTTEHLDIYPTLAEICGLEGAPANLHGVSVASLLKKPHAAWDKPAVTQFLHPYADKPSVQGYSIRTERYRYTVWSGGETGEELYDYNADPHEWHNLARDPAMQQIKSGLAQKMQTILCQRTSQI